MERFVNFVKKLRYDTAERVPVDDGAKRDRLYRAGYANGYNDALDEVWQEIEEEVGE